MVIKIKNEDIHYLFKQKTNVIASSCKTTTELSKALNHLKRGLKLFNFIILTSFKSSFANPYPRGCTL